VDRAFGGRVREDPRQRYDARHGSDIDDGATLTRADKVFAKYLAAEKHPFEVHAHDAIELLLADLEKRRGRIDARAVDDDVDTAGARENGIAQRLDLGLARGLGGVKPCAAAGGVDLRDARVRLFLASGGFWRSWFDKPNERQFADEVRAFVVALDYLLDVPPTMLTRGDLTSIGEDIERVVKRVESQIESSPEDAASLAPAIYVIRTRYEELYRRGALKAD